MSAIERWLLLSKWEEAAAGVTNAEPLFPCVATSPNADAAFAQDLVRLGADKDVAKDLTACVRKAAIALATEVKTLSQDSNALGKLPRSCKRAQADDGTFRLSVATGGAGQPSAQPVEVVITAACAAKLQKLYGSSNVTSTDEAFNAHLFCCLLRYHSLGGAGFQAGIGAPVFRALQASLGCSLEAFASPLNCFYGPHCSAFADVDAPFGSLGSFAKLAPERGSYEVNPPFVPAIIDQTAELLLRLLHHAQAFGERLAFVVVIPKWPECAGYRALAAAPPSLLRATLNIAAERHGFVDGAAHRRRATHRESPYDTAVFVLQTDAAASAWMADAPAMARVEHAFAACTPTAAELQQVDSSERVHRKGRARREPRRRMKRAGKQTKARKLKK